MPDDLAAGRRRSYHTALLVVAVAAAGLNLRTAIAGLPPLFPDLAARLHLSSAVLSLLAAAPVICFGVASAFAAWLSRRFGEERTLFAALGVLCAGLLLRGLWPGVLLFPGTILAGSAIGILNVLLSSLVKRRWPERAGLLLGIYLTGLSVGAILASLLSVPLYQASGGSVRISLGVWAGPAALAMLLWLPQLRYRALGRGRPAATPAPDGPGRSAAMAAPDGAAAPAAHIKVHRYALSWQVMGFMGLQSLLFYAALSWLPTIFQDRGTSAVAAGNLLALMAAGNLAAAFFVPALAQRTPDQRMLVVPSMALTGVGLVGCLWAPPGQAALWTFLLGVSQGACLALAIFFTIARAPDPGAAASLSGFAQSGGYLVASAGPLEVGLLHAVTGSWDIPVLLLLVLVVAGIAVGVLAARPLVLPPPGGYGGAGSPPVLGGLRGVAPPG